MRIFATAPLATLCVASLAALLAPATLPADDRVFETKVAPILKAHCRKCHAEKEPQGGLNLTTLRGLLKGSDTGPVVIDGAPEKSLLVQKITAKEMPPPDEKDPLPAQQLAVIGNWIKGRRAAAGSSQTAVRTKQPEVTAKDRQFWSFRPPVAGPLPPVHQHKLVRTPIDDFLLARLEAKGLSFSPEASKLTLLRRAHLDLTGLPPSLQDVQAFLADTRSDAYERLIDRLLDSPRYGERWGRHWLDVAGYTDCPHTDNAGDFLPVDDWRYRDYVVRALNQDKPYDRFLQEQIAGDELVDWRGGAKLATPAVDALVATGYLRMTPDLTHGDQMQAVNYRYDTLSRVVENVSSGVLGLTMGCVKCHTHKFDPIPHQDYYRLMAIFATAYNPDDWKRPIDRWIADPSVPAWHAKGSPQKADSLVPAPRYGRIQALFDVGPPPTIHELMRGNSDTPGPAVDPGFVTVLCKPGETAAKRPADTHGNSSGRRLAFARWLTRRDNPLTARVFVNRMWQHHFGKGIVATPENFGHTGMRPTHPELLDWLAVDFMEHGWRIKPLHKLILCSTAYRQAASRSAETAGNTVDPENDLLWRMNLRRLDAEVLRDDVLSVSGKLDLTMGGPPVPLESHADGLVTVTRNGPTPTSRFRRSLYLRELRGSHPSGKGFTLSMLEIFDYPEMVLNCTRRTNSTTPLQSLALINSEFTTEQARYLAERVRTLCGAHASFEKQVEAAFLLALGRKPKASEIQFCVDDLKAQTELFGKQKQTTKEPAERALASLCLILFASNEFLYIG